MKYDCVIGASGGLDSSNVIYLAKKILNLLVIHNDSDFSYDPANQNLETICRVLDVELRTFRSKLQNDQKYVKCMVKALMGSMLFLPLYYSRCNI